MKRKIFDDSGFCRGLRPRTKEWLRKLGPKRIVTSWNDVLDLAEFASSLEMELEAANHGTTFAVGYSPEYGDAPPPPNESSNAD